MFPRNGVLIDISSKFKRRFTAPFFFVRTQGGCRQCYDAAPVSRDWRRPLFCEQGFFPVRMQPDIMALKVQREEP